MSLIKIISPVIRGRGMILIMILPNINTMIYTTKRFSAKNLMATTAVMGGLGAGLGGIFGGKPGAIAGSMLGSATGMGMYYADKRNRKKI